MALQRMWTDLLRAVWPELPSRRDHTEPLALLLASAELLHTAIAAGGAPLPDADLIALRDLNMSLNRILADFESLKAQTVEERRLGKALARIKREYLR